MRPASPSEIANPKSPVSSLPSLISNLYFLSLIIFIVALAPRLSALNNYVTPDEPNWAYRTANFSVALARGDWAATAQAGHPGVTTQWLGSLGIALQSIFDPASTDAAQWLTRLDFLAPDNIEAFKRIGIILDWARLPIIVVNALGVVAMFWLTRRLFDVRIALLAALLIALDPFIAGLGSLLHVDGLLTTFVALSLLSTLNALHPSTNTPHSHTSFFKWLSLAGIFSALALLTKTPALFLIPFTALIIFIAFSTKRLSLRQVILGFILFTALTLAFFFILYPAMWSDPTLALDIMFERAGHHLESATRPTFFDGQVELNHGIAFYPLALLYRLSPITLIGLVIAIVYLIISIYNRRLTPILLHSDTSSIVVLALFALTFIAFLTPAAKKFDRYLAPILPGLIVIAAWAFDRLAHNRLRLIRPFAVVLQALFTFSVIPYLLMAYNPLAGGASAARDRIAVGWGEGFGAAAHWVEVQTPGATIATGGMANLAPVFDGQTIRIDPAGVAAADYVVVTVSEVQLDPNLLNSLDTLATRVHTIQAGGTDMAYIYGNSQAIAQAEAIRNQYQNGDAVLLDAATPLAHQLDFDSLNVLPLDVTPEQISATLDTLHARSRILYVSTPAVSAVVHQQVMQWLDRNAQLENVIELNGATLNIYRPNRDATQALDPFIVQFDGTLALLGIEPESRSVAYPGDIVVVARWLAFAPSNTDYAAVAELTDADRNNRVRFGDVLRNNAGFGTSTWQPGAVIEQRYRVQVPGMLAPDDYRLRFSIDRPDGSRAALVSASGTFSGTAPLLASIQIEPALRAVDPVTLDIVQRIDHIWPGQAELLGVDLFSTALVTGDRLLMTAYWRSLHDQLDPATPLRWQLHPIDSNTCANCTFDWRAPLAATIDMPLREGDVFGVIYSDTRIPLDLPAGRYQLSLGLGDAAIDVATIDIAESDRAFDLPARATHVGSTGPFDFYLTKPLPTQATRGEPFQLQLALRAREEVNINYTVFAHLLDPDGRVVAQVDTWPQGGAWPTANWVKAQVVTDTFNLMIPSDAPSGPYTISLGMYDALDGTHLSPRDSEDHLLPGIQLPLDALIQLK